MTEKEWAETKKFYENHYRYFCPHGLKDDLPHEKKQFLIKQKELLSLELAHYYDHRWSEVTRTKAKIVHLQKLRLSDL